METKDKLQVCKVVAQAILADIQITDVDLRGDRQLLLRHKVRDGVPLSERSRGLATLRVVGFTRAEISFILLGELTVVTLLAVPLGFLIGYGLAALVWAAVTQAGPSTTA